MFRPFVVIPSLDANNNRSLAAAQAEMYRREEEKQRKIKEFGVWSTWLKYSKTKSRIIAKKMIRNRIEQGIKYKHGFTKAATDAIYRQSQCSDEWAVIDAFVRVEKEYLA